MKDITQQIKNAISQDVLWSIDIFFVVKEHLIKNGYEVSYWENEENWAIILIKNKTIAYLWKKYPLIFVNSQYSKTVRDLLREYNFLSFIHVEDFKKKDFKITSESLKDKIDCGINLEGFSVEDLWFYTNSI